MTISVEELPKIPANWKWVHLDDIGQIITGKTPSKKKQEYYGNDVPFYKPTDLNADYYVRESHDNLSKLGAEKARLIPEKSILVTCIGATIGKAGLIRKEGAFNQQINAIIPSDKTISEYVFYFVKSPLMQKQIQDNASATTLPILNKTKFEQLFFPLAPLNIQNRIVNKLDQIFSQLDSGLSSLQRTKLLLQQYRQSILKAAMTGELTKEWREKHYHELEPASVLLERILLERRQKWEEEQLAKFQAQRKIPKDESWKKKYKKPLYPNISDLHQLPRNWIWSSISQITTLMRNGIYKPREYYSDDGFACLRMYNIDDGKIIWKDIKRMILNQDEIDNYKLETGDIIVNRVNSKELVGKSALIPENLEKCIYESKNIRIKINKYLNSSFVNYWLLLYRQEYFYQHFQQTVGMASINQEQLGLMPIPLPPQKENNEIIKLLERYISTYDYTEKEIYLNQMKFNLLRQSILKSAFDGKLVPQNSESKANERLQKEVHDY